MPSVPGHPLMRTVSGDPMGDMLRTVAGNPMGNMALSVAGNPLGGDEAVKGYQHYLMGGGAPYTEQNLSDRGYRSMLNTAYNALPTGKGIDYYNYPNNDIYGGPDVTNLIGETSPIGLRRVNIAGHPYVQVRDVYDFRNDPEDIPVSLNTLRYALGGNLGSMRHIGVVAGQTLGKPYPVNMLFPENPANVASPNAVNYFRQKSMYSLDPKGNVVQNNALTYGSPQ